MSDMAMYYCYYESPIGKLLIAGSKDSLELISFASGKMSQQPQTNWLNDAQQFSTCMQQLDEYFAGIRKSFDLPCTLHGTDFQKKVMECVARVPYGSTASYGAIAAQIKHPKAVRAVGMANARNNLPIIFPCHRIIAKSGDLTGFGGGLEVKKFLLSLENKKITY